MKNPDNDEWLDDILSHSQEPLSDDGFTEGVVGNLPTHRRSQVRTWVAPSWMIAASILFYGFGGLEAVGGASFFEGFTLGGWVQTSAALWVVTALIVFVAWVPFTILFEED